VGEDNGLAQRGEEHGRSESNPGSKAGDVGERGERLEPRLGHDAVADPDRVIAGLVGEAGHGPAFFDGRPARGLHDDAASGNEDAEAHGQHVSFAQPLDAESWRPMKSRMRAMALSVSAPARWMKPWRAPGKCTRSI